MSFLRQLPFGIGFLFLCIPFYRVLLFTDRVLLFRDLVRDFLPQKLLWAESWRNGIGIPFWNHFSFGGNPYWAMNVGSPLHPLNFLFVAFPPGDEARALSIFLFAHYFIFYWGSYRLARIYSLDRISAAIFAVSFTTGGYLLSIHSLGHLLVSLAAVPWFFVFFLRWTQRRSLLTLLPLGACLGWPIYGGDPQVSYLLTIFITGYFLFFAKIGWPQRLLAIFLLGMSSLLFSAAQFLPTFELAMQSMRAKSEVEDLVLFSFHPIRLLEFIFPLFFGNRLGFETFWADAWINFPYKNPFVFSIYPGVFFLWIFFTTLVSNRKFSRLELGLLATMGFFLILSFGEFSFVPVYQWLALYFPAFPYFRYPERLTFWALLALFFFLLNRWPQIEASAVSRKAFYPLIFIFILTTIAIYRKDIPISKFSSIGILSSAIGFGILLEWQNRFRKKKYYHIGLLVVIALDLIWNQTYLVWDQNKHILDTQRYPLTMNILKDLEARKEKIKGGDRFRFSGELFFPLQHSNSYMDHLTSTTHGILDTLSPNSPTLFGIEDISGYFSFVRADRVEFWNKIIRNGDARVYFDLLGAYYIPKRGDYQIPVLEKNETAQPYLFAPEKVFFADPIEIYDVIYSGNFRSFKDVVAISSDPNYSQKLEKGNFEILARNGRKIQFRYYPEEKSSKKFLQLNESFDRHWRASVNGVDTPVLLSNGWAMGIIVDSHAPVLAVELSYESPWIFWGVLGTTLWWIIAIFAFIFRKRSLILNQNRSVSSCR